MSGCKFNCAITSPNTVTAEHHSKEPIGYLQLCLPWFAYDDAARKACSLDLLHGVANVFYRYTKNLPTSVLHRIKTPSC
jgi:hypothetical protein